MNIYIYVCVCVCARPDLGKATTYAHGNILKLKDLVKHNWLLLVLGHVSLA